MPDDASLIGGQRVLQLALNAGEGDRLLVLISGGASALIEHPLPGVSLADIRTINRQLLKAGADIKEINTVRKKISAIKGGRLAVAAMPAEVFLLAISDVPGDCLSDIGSGPCSPDTTSPADAHEILRRYHCDVPVGVLAAINNPNNTPPAPNYPAFAHVTSRVIARAKDALDAVSRVVGEAGYEPVRLGDDISTSARDLAAEHARLAMQHRSRQGRYALISGGETSVQVVNPEGRGGRNTEYLLSLALALDGASGIWALAADTDGIDGTEDNAGATISPDTLVHATRLGLDGPAMLADNLSYDFFAAVEGLLVTGPTGTNVNDLRIILIDGLNATH
jgi:hydroxypyruvate reductase